MIQKTKKTGCTLQERIKKLNQRLKSDKLGILIGNSYPKTKYEIKNISVTIKDMKRFLTQEHFRISVLTDINEPEFKNTANSTKQNILNCLDNLSNKNFNKLFFQFSGHGYYNIDNTPHKRRIFERSNDNLVLCSDSQFISDSEINEKLQKFKKTSKICLLFDSCHSKISSADLKYRLEFSPGSSIVLLSDRKLNNRNDKCVADIISISGYKDESINENVFKVRNHKGVMTTAFIAAFNSTNGGNVSVEDFVRNMKFWLLQNNYQQIPQLSFSNPYAYRKLMKNYL